jgi:hypothetical protein
MVEPAPAPEPAPVITDAVEIATAEKAEIESLIETNRAEGDALTASIDQAEAAINAVLDANVLDRPEYDRLRSEWLTLIDDRNALRAHGERLQQRWDAAETKRVRAIAATNATQREGEVRQFQIEVEENEQQLLSDMRRLFAMADGKVGGDLSWLSGGSEMLRYFTRLGELSAWAQSLGLAEPYRFGTGLFDAMLRVGMRDPRTP